jgi:multiple sugar transport system substrate-binding protein
MAANPRHRILPAAISGLATPAAGRHATAPISRRDFLRVLGTAAAGATLAACSPGSASGTLRRSANVQLVFQDCRCRGEQRLLERFHETHPTIQVFYTPDPEDMESAMLADMQAGTAPDVLAGCCDFFPVWAQKGYLLDLRPFVEADLDQGTIGDWDAAQYRSFITRDGLQYALPKYHGALALLYNKDLFDAAGLDYPDGTWDHADYLRAMRTLAADRDGDGMIDRWGSMVDISWERLQMHVNGWGGHFVDPQDPTRSWMGRPEALAALEWVRARIWDDHVMASTLDVQNLQPRQAFIDQRLAMVEEGSWALKDVLEGADFRLGVAPFPAGPARRVTLATTDGFAIYAGTQHPEAAWELLKFLISPEYGRAMARDELLQPARASLVEEWADLIREQYPHQSQGLDLAAFAEGHLQGYSVTAEVFADMASALSVVRPAWEEIFKLGQAPVDSLRETSALIEQAQLGGA